MFLVQKGSKPGHVHQTYILFVKANGILVADPGNQPPRFGRQPIIWPNFPQKLHKNERIWTERGSVPGFFPLISGSGYPTCTFKCKKVTRMISLKLFEGQRFFGGLLVTPFVPLMTSKLGLKPRVGPLPVYFLACVQWIPSIDVWTDT